MDSMFIQSPIQLIHISDLEAVRTALLATELDSFNASNWRDLNAS